MGEEKERLGKYLCFISVIESSLIMGLIAMFTYFFAHDIANAYTDDMDTVALLKYCMESVSICIFITGTTLSLQGALKALQ